MKKKLNIKKGFTLIELLVVVAIISLLSSIVMASLNSARAKSKDAFLREEGDQMRTLLEEEYNDTGSYIGLQPNGTWIATSADCDAASFTGNYVAQARTICKAIVSNASTTWYALGKFYLGTQGILSNKYSIQIGLPYKNTFFCLGSSGQVSDIANSGSVLLSWPDPGCWGNP